MTRSAVARPAALVADLEDGGQPLVGVPRHGHLEAGNIGFEVGDEPVDVLVRQVFSASPATHLSIGTTSMPDPARPGNAHQ